MTSLADQLEQLLIERNKKIAQLKLYDELIEETTQQFINIPESKTVTTVKTFNRIKADAKAIEKIISRLNKKITSLQKRIKRVQAQ